MSSEPAIVIRIPLEGKPQSWPEVMFKGDAKRLDDWMQSRPELQHLAAAATAAYEAMVRRDEEQGRFKL
jgi:hypothetical protein